MMRPSFSLMCSHRRPCDNPRGARALSAVERAMSDLPSGTVTFLFTDIEGSTALWERDSAAMRTAVERHLAILRHTIEAHGGVLFKTVGDAVQAAFATAADGL